MVFSWGVLVWTEEDSGWVLTPPNMTFLYGAVSLALLLAPAVVVLCFQVDRYFSISLSNLGK